MVKQCECTKCHVIVYLKGLILYDVTFTSIKTKLKMMFAQKDLGVNIYKGSSVNYLFPSSEENQVPFKVLHFS